MQKVADAGGYKSVLKSLFSSPSFVAALGAPMVAGGVHFAAKKMKAKEDATARAEAYKGMLELNPTLRQRDQKRVAQIYSSLGNVNPIMARDPLVAGAFVNNIMENTSQLGDEAGNQALLAQVKEMAGIGAHLSTARKNNNPNAIFDTTSNILSNLGGAVEKGMKSNFHDLQSDLTKQRDSANEEIGKKFKALDEHKANTHANIEQQKFLLNQWMDEQERKRDGGASKHAAAEEPTTGELGTLFAALGI
jgi:hypothetical protein